MRGSIKEVHSYPFIIGNFEVKRKVKEGVYEVKSYMSPLPENEDIGANKTLHEYVVQTTDGYKMVKGDRYMIVARLLTLNRGEGESPLLRFKAYIIIKSKILNLIHNSFIPSWEIKEIAYNRDGVSVTEHKYRTEMVKDKYLEVLEVTTELPKKGEVNPTSNYQGCYITKLSKEGSRVIANPLIEDSGGILGHWCDVMKIAK